MLPLTMMVKPLVNGELYQNAGPVVAREQQLVEDWGGRLQQGGGHLVKHNSKDDGEDEEEEHEVGDHDDDDGYEQLVENWGGRLQYGGGHLVKHNNEKRMMVVTMMMMALSVFLGLEWDKGDRKDTSPWKAP